MKQGLVILLAELVKGGRMPNTPAFAVRRATWRAASILGVALLAAPAAAWTEPPGPPTPAPESPSVSEITVEPHCLTYPEARAYYEKHGGEGLLDPDDLALASPGKGHRTEPSPGTRESLIRFLNSLWAGQPNYDEMSNMLAQGVHAQWGGDKAKVLGKPTAIQFMGVSRRDYDVYAVEWQCAKGIWAVGPLDPSGKVYRRAHLVISYGSVNLLTGR
jgi:hypothetical protein